jgi:MFS family permease
LGAVLAAIAYALLARRVAMRMLLAIGIATCAAGALPYMYYNSLSAAWVIDFQYGLFYGFAYVASMDLAARACPAGCEGLAFSLMMSVTNLSYSGADTLGAHWSDAYHLSWNTMVLINAATTALVLVILPFMPGAIMKSRDNQVPNLENTGEPAMA